MHLWLVLATTFALGLAYNAAPGPINVESLRRGSVEGFRVALLVQLGAAIGETLWAALALVGLGWLIQNAVLHALLLFCGVLLLLHVGISAWHDRDATHRPSGSQQTPFLWGALMSLANPTSVGFWLAAGAGVLSFSDAQALIAKLGILLAFVASTLVWAVLAAAVAQWSRTLMAGHLHRWLHRGCAGMLLGMGGMACWQLVHLL